ncbi:hypothetical protein ACFY9A_02805 [Streptomyces rubradiris]|uniref:hypothetical protein n=1 Tax=Streptomyces rubradiris TaxID=285531 RepID=UPI0033BFFE79
MTTPYAKDQRDPHGSVAPAVATALLFLLGPLALALGGLSAMATDACGPDNCPAALETSLSLIHDMLTAGWLFSPAALLIAWLLPRKRRWSAARTGAALAALVPPVSVLYLVLTLPAG